MTISMTDEQIDDLADICADKQYLDYDWEVLSYAGSLICPITEYDEYKKSYCRNFLERLKKATGYRPIYIKFFLGGKIFDIGHPEYRLCLLSRYCLLYKEYYIIDTIPLDYSKKGLEFLADVVARPESYKKLAKMAELKVKILQNERRNECG